MQKKVAKKKPIKKAKSERVSKDLLEIICCPTDKGELGYDATKDTLTCKKCKHNYKVEKGIPILLRSN